MAPGLLRLTIQNHRHAGIGLTTPHQVDHGLADAIHAAKTTRTANKSLDRSASQKTGKPSLNQADASLISIDTFRGSATGAWYEREIA